MEHKIFIVEGMACEHCQANVERALAALPGVKAAHASVASKSVEVDYDPAVVGTAQMREAVDEAGYELCL